MESCNLLDSDWERWGLWVNSSHNNDGVFDLSSPLDQSLISGLEDANNNDGKSDLFAKWMDEKMDLSVMHLEGQPGLLDDLDVMIEDPTALLENLMDWSSEILENELDILNIKLEKNTGEVLEALPELGYVATPDSPGGTVPDNSFTLSPESQQESLYVKPFNLKNPSFNHKSEDIDQLTNYLESESNSPDVPELSADYSNSQLSPSTSVSSVETLDSVDSKDTCVLSCNSPATENSLPVEVSFIYFDSENDSSLEESKEQEVTHLTRKRSKNHKKLLSASNSAPAGEFRRERKRKQNKDAATRYRQKKRKESIAIKTEESILEDRNMELKNKVQQLSNEISYLKGLLKEAKLRMQSSKLP